MEETGMKQARKIFLGIEWVAGILSALVTAYFALYHLWDIFRRWQFTDGFGILLGLLLVVAAVAAIGGYLSAQCIQRNLSLSVFLLVIAFLMLLWFVGMIVCGIFTECLFSM